MSFTAVPALRAWLHDALRAEPALEGVQVAASWPAEVQRDSIVIGTEADSTFAPRVMRTGPTRPREEVIVITVHIYSGRADGNPTGATERAYALAEAVENVIRQDATLGGSCYVSDMTALRLMEGAEAGRRDAYLGLEITAKARS